MRSLEEDVEASIHGTCFYVLSIAAINVPSKPRGCAAA
jgi:hypothetical protein